MLLVKFLFQQKEEPQQLKLKMISLELILILMEMLFQQLKTLILV